MTSRLAVSSDSSSSTSTSRCQYLLDQWSMSQYRLRRLLIELVGRMGSPDDSGAPLHLEDFLNKPNMSQDPPTSTNSKSRV